MFIATLFLIARVWKNLYQLKMNEYKNMVYTHTHTQTMEYYLAIERRTSQQCKWTLRALC